MKNNQRNSFFSNPVVQGTIFVICFAAVFLLGYRIITFENSNLYKPDKADTQNPWLKITTVLGENIQNLTFKSTSGVSLNAAYSPAQEGMPTIVLSHGNAGHIGTRVHIMGSLIDNGYGVLMYDYQGYGLSEGTPSESGLYEDLNAASDYLKNTHHVPIKNQIAMGESLGCAVTVHVAQHRKFKAVVLLAPFTSIPEMAKVIYPNIPLQWIITQPFDSLSKIQAISSPLIIAHGSADDTVPHTMGKTLFDAATVTQKTWINIPHAGHNTIYENAAQNIFDALDEIETEIH